MGVPLAFVKSQARVGPPSGLGLRPRAATALWPTGPGPGGIVLQHDLWSGLTRGQKVIAAGRQTSDDLRYVDLNFLPLNKGEVPKAEGVSPQRLGCEGATLRERHASELAHTFAGRGVPPDRRRRIV